MTDPRTTDPNLDRDGDGRHDFEAATTSAQDDQMTDVQGHEFTKGRVSTQDEASEA